MSGIHYFVRAEQYRRPVTRLQPGEPNPNERRFDSDPRRSIPMAFGYRPGSLRLEPIEKTEDYDKFNVYAKTGQAPTGEGEVDRPEIFIGTMVTTSMVRAMEMSRPGVH
jgi:hypothetical protein